MKDIEDEIPFDVPEGWAWCRLKNICLEFIVPQRDKPTTFDGNIPWCRIEDIEGKYLNGSLSNQLVSMETIKKMNMHICPKGSIICSCSASLGVQAIVTVDCCTNKTFIGIVPKHEVLFNEYLYYFLGAQTKYFNEIATGTTIKYISRDKFENLLFPLTPIMEQEKTVSAIEHYFSLINAIENDKSDLQTAIKQAKSKILDLAIHGKLVPQDSSDEPASVLLEKLRTEKEAKIKAGELKRDKNDSYIYKSTTDNCYYEKFADGTEEEVELPYDLPESWSWIKIKDVISYIGDGDWIESKDQSDNGIRLIQTGNIGFGKFRDKEGKYHYITEETFDKLCCNEIFPGDILISRLPEPVGRACIIPNLSQRLITAVDCTIIRLNEKIIIREYFVYYTQSSKYLGFIKDNCTGTTRLRISRANLEKIYIPLPSLSEQQRILNKIESLFTKLDEIALNLI